MKILSFRVDGQYAAFRDPSVTSNQSVYYIPSKSALVGLIGSMLGVERPDSLGDLYSENVIKLFSEILVGLHTKTAPKKITFYSNHRSLKEPKTKPFKTEVVERPSYVVYVATERHYNKLVDAVQNNRPEFPPYLGHAYCPAVISRLTEYDSKLVNPNTGEIVTKCVVPDGSEIYNEVFKPRISNDSGSVIIERHMHHFLTENGIFDKRVLKYWIPVSGSGIEIDQSPPGDFAKFYNVGDRVVCLY